MTSAEVAIHEVWFDGANTLFARTASKWLARKMPDFNPVEAVSFDTTQALHALEHFCTRNPRLLAKCGNLCGDAILQWHECFSLSAGKIVLSRRSKRT